MIRFDRFELIGFVRTLDEHGEVTGERPVMTTEGQPFRAFTVKQLAEIAEQMKASVEEPKE